jgi:hypothetical protein
MGTSGPKLIVRFHAGYKADETPRALVWAGREYPVEQVLSRKRCRGQVPGKSWEVFVVRVAGKTLILRINESGEAEALPGSDLSFLIDR